MGRLERYWAGKVAVVTGGGSGMGRHMVRELAAAGARVAAVDVAGDALRDAVAAAVAAAAPAPAGGSAPAATAHLCDVSDRPAVLRLVDEVVAQHGRVDAIFNNAGVVCAQTTFETTFEEWDRVVGIDLFGVVNCTIAFLPHLLKSPQAAVVNTSSIAGILGMPGNSAYGTAKFGVRGFTEVLLTECRELHPNVTVTVVHPGGVSTDIFQNCRHLVHDTKIEVAKGWGMKNADMLHDMLHKLAATTPQDAARQIVTGVARGRTRIMVGTDAWLLDIASRLCPHGVLRHRYPSLLIVSVCIFAARFIGRRALLGAATAAAVAWALRS